MSTTMVSFDKLKVGQLFNYSECLVALKIHQIDVIGGGRKNAVIFETLGDGEGLNGEAVWVLADAMVITSMPEAET
jgi:hypothetical protein